MNRCHYRLGALLVFVLAGLPALAAADPVTFRTRVSFVAAVGTTFVDDYSNPGYTHGDVHDSYDLDEHSDAHMSAVLGETQYETTGWLNHNLIVSQSEDPKYCAGCNGSFRLIFTGTSLGDAYGVPGVGFDFSNAAIESFYGALVTFGDGSVRSYSLPTTSSGMATPRFWGITALEGIQSIHFGPGGGTETSIGGSFVIDNLTLGAPALEPVPEPATLLLVGTGLALAARRRAKA